MILLSSHIYENLSPPSFETRHVSCFYSDGCHGLQGFPDVLMLKPRQTCIQMCALTMRRRATSNIPYNMRTWGTCSRSHKRVWRCGPLLQMLDWLLKGPSGCKFLVQPIKHTDWPISSLKNQISWLQDFRKVRCCLVGTQESVWHPCGGWTPRRQPSEALLNYVNLVGWWTRTDWVDPPKADWLVHQPIRLV